MGQLNQKIEAWRNERSTDNKTTSVDPYDVINALTPNGIFPPEVVDLILQYFGPDPESLFNSAISCKLWLQTGSLLLKGFRRYKLDPNAPNFQLRREILVQETIEKNIKNGEYWVNVFAKPYLVVNRSSTMFNFDWSISKNLIAISCDKTIRMSMGPENLFSRGKAIDLSNSRELDAIEWGTHLVGGVQVIPSRSNWGWDWSEFSCYVDRKRTAKITCKNKVVEESSDPYRYLRVPKRVIAALNNLDDSPTVLLYQRHYAQSKNVNGLSHDYTVESYDLLTGQMLHETKIDGLGPVIGFFKNYAICSSETTTVFVDLADGVVAKKFPIGSITQNSFCICDRKIGFAVDTLVIIFDWTSCRQIKKFSINGLFDQSVYQKQNRQMQIQGMAFDRWKLVLGIGAEKEGAEDYSEKLKEGDTVPTFIAIFDMHDGFKLLQSIHLPNTFKGNRPFKIALPPKGSIVVENWSLIEIDFNHPCLVKQLPVAFFECAKEELALQVSKVPPMQFSDFVQKKLKCEISDIRSITFFERDPHIERKIRNHRKYMLDQSKGPSNWKSVRITFFFKYSATGYNDATNFTELGEFKNYYEKLPDVVSVFDLTLKNFAPNSKSHVSQRASSVPGNCVLIFERFNEETGQWDIIEPFAPKGINFGK